MVGDISALASTCVRIKRSIGRKAEAVLAKSPHNSARDNHRFSGPKSSSCCR
jgi:hypothetical protein